MYKSAFCVHIITPLVLQTHCHHGSKFYSVCSRQQIWDAFSAIENVSQRRLTKKSRLNDIKDDRFRSHLKGIKPNSKVDLLIASSIKQDVQRTTAPSADREKKCQHWLSVAISNSDPLQATLHHVTKFQAMMWFPHLSSYEPSSFRPGPSLSWKLSKFCETRKIGGT